MIDQESIIVHGLTHTDLNDSDKMKFAPVEKITKTRVTECLIKPVPESEGTVLYLTMMRYMMEVFIKHLSRQISTPKDAISKLWYDYTVFFIYIKKPINIFHLLGMFYSLSERGETIAFRSIIRSNIV